MKKIVFSLLSLLVVSSFPIASFAAACPIGSTLAGIIGLGSCSIGDATFSFAGPSVPPPPAGEPVYFPGPFAGNSGAGPSSSQIIFTPIADLNNPGFTLSGPFIAAGGPPSIIPSTGLLVAGSNFMETFGYFTVALPAGQSISGASVAITGAAVSNDIATNEISVGLDTIGASPFSLLRGDGASRLSTFSALSGGPFAGSLPVIANFNAFDRSTDVTSFAKFDAATFRFQEFAAPVPEPEIYAMMAIGLGMVGFLSRRRKQLGAAA
jgi:hypothetical protein